MAAKEKAVLAREHLERALPAVTAEDYTEAVTWLWFVAPAGIVDIFNPDADELWGRVLARKGAHFALVARMPIDPSVN